MNDTPKKIATWVITIIVALGGLAVVGMAAQWWIQREVSAQLAEKGVISTSDYEKLDTRVDGLETLHEKDVVRVEGKAERIAQILMEGD